MRLVLRKLVDDQLSVWNFLIRKEELKDKGIGVKSSGFLFPLRTVSAPILAVFTFS